MGTPATDEVIARLQNLSNNQQHQQLRQEFERLVEQQGLTFPAEDVLQWVNQACWDHSYKDGGVILLLSGEYKNPLLDIVQLVLWTKDAAAGQDHGISRFFKALLERLTPIQGEVLEQYGAEVLANALATIFEARKTSFGTHILKVLLDDARKCLTRQDFATLVLAYRKELGIYRDKIAAEVAKEQAALDRLLKQ